MKLSILCVTRLERHALPFLEKLLELSFVCRDSECVLALDGKEVNTLGYPYNRFAKIIRVQSEGFIESVLEEAIDACSGDYILRIDDDEVVSQPMRDWLVMGRYLYEDQWCFPRAWLWPDIGHYIRYLHFWPDWQTRLSVRAKAGGRTRIHQGSPFGSGHPVFMAIEHHKLLVQTLEERRKLVEHYEEIQPGAGCGRFYLPEDQDDLLVSEWRGEA